MKRDEKYLIRQQVCFESIYFDIQTEPCSQVPYKLNICLNGTLISWLANNFLKQR